MSDSVLVRLVRCPKCEKLLPELADYSVYQCGGCGAVLRAKIKDPGTKDLDEKSGGEAVGVYAKLDDDISEKGRDNNSEYLSENGGAASSAFNMGVESNVEPPGTELNSIATPDYDIRSQNVAANEPAMRADPEVSVSGSELDNVEVVLKYFGKVSQSRRSEDVPHWQDEGAGQRSQFQGDHVARRTFKSKFPEEGPSKNFPDSNCNYNEEANLELNSTTGPERIGKLEKDRAELLQMMEQLRDQLHRSGDLGGNIKGKVNVAHQGPDRSSYGISNKVAPSNTGMHQQYMPDRPCYHPHSHQQRHHASRHRMGMHNSHPFANGHSDMPGYGNYLDSRMMRGQFLAPNHHDNHPPYAPYHPGHHLNADPSAYGPYFENGLFLGSECSCFECRILHNRDNTPYFDDIRFTDIPNNSMFYPSSMPGPSAQRGHCRRTHGPSSSLNDPSVRVRFADDVKYYAHGYVGRHHQNAVMVKDGLHCQPVAFGAPFIICHSCSKLLQLPESTLKRGSGRKKLRCGACDTVIYYTVIDNKLTISVPGETKKSVKDVGNSSDDMVHRGISPELVGWAGRTSVSEGFDSSSYEFQAADDKPLVPPRALDLTLNETQDSQSLSPSSPASFEGVESPEGRASPPQSGLPGQNQLGHSFNANVTNGIWKGSQSTRSDHDKVMPKDMISRQNSLNETSSTAAIEEVSFNVHSDTRVSQKKETTMKENDIARTNKGSIFAGIIKKSLKNISRPNPLVDNRDGNVTVNGHKIPDQLVKKAEKLAGPVQPGKYWYDSRAGFWGVIGGPCKGIIPPFIEEFNYPMPVNCSAGATGVLVNGRELHQSDLDLLATRGLPTARGRSYIIEISGKVLDADSGGELDGLGRLAPTIEKVKHGFGMKMKAPAR